VEGLSMARSYGVEFVLTAFRFNIGRVSAFLGIEQADASKHAADADHGAPTLIRISAIDTNEFAGLLALMGLALVLPVLPSVGQAKILDLVVEAVTVSMVYQLWRPRFMNVEPSKPMGQIATPINLDVQVAVPIVSAGYLAGSLVHSSVNNPGEHTSQMVIGEKFTQSRVRDNFASHDAPRLLIGQGPASAINTVPALLFYEVSTCA